MLLVGAVSFTALGVGVSTVVRTAEGSSAVVNAIYLPAGFIAGAFFSTDSFPQVLRGLADVLPLSYFIRLVRDVLVDDEQVWNEPATSPSSPPGARSARWSRSRRFRWEPRER